MPFIHTIAISCGYITHMSKIHRTALFFSAYLKTIEKGEKCNNGKMHQIHRYECNFPNGIRFDWRLYTGVEHVKFVHLKSNFMLTETQYSLIWLHTMTNRQSMHCTHSHTITDRRIHYWMWSNRCFVLISCNLRLHNILFCMHVCLRSDN